MAFNVHSLVHSTSSDVQPWIMSEKSRATEGAMPRASVMTGKATAPPPSDVMPAMVAPNIIVMERMYLLCVHILPFISRMYTEHSTVLCL